ncbi:MAG: DUF4388 domain-containing protein [Acidobacteriota bacterium]
MDKSYQYRGELQQTSLPEMFFKIHHFSVPGIMQARRGEIEKRVFLRSGNVVHAASTDLDDSLGAFLQRTGRLKHEEFEAVMRDRSSKEQRLGVLLVERGLMSPAEVYAAVCDQVEEILWSLFRWEDGEVTFAISEFPDDDMVRINLPIRRVIVQGIRRAPSAKSLVARLGSRETMFEPAYRVEDLIEIGLEGPEYQLLNMVNGRRSLYDLCLQGPLSQSENAKLLYAFFVLQLIRRAESSGGIKIRLKAEGEGFGGGAGSAGTPG